MIASALARVFSSSPQARATTAIDPRILSQFVSIPQMLAGVRLTVDDAMQLSAVWACMDAITKAIASCAWNVLTIDAERRRALLPNDSLVWLLNTRPNPDMTAIAFRECMMFSALSWGNGYAEIVRTNGGVVAELWPLPADSVEMGNDASGKIVYVYRPKSGDTTPVVLQPKQVFHLRGPSLSGYLGENMVSRAARTLALSLAAERFSSNFYANNTVIGGMLEYPKTLTDPAYLRLKKDWEEKHKGPSNAHKPVILENGMKWVPLEVDASKAQTVESRQFQIEEICRFFGVPPHKVQHLLRATFNNIEHLGIEFVRDAITPWALRWEQEADYKLCAPRVPKFTKLDTAWLSYGDAKSRAEYYQIMRRIGCYSANDILEMEGRNAIGDEGDVRIVEANMQTLEYFARQDDQLDTGEDRAMALQATSALLAHALTRYQRSLENRRADLARSGVPNDRALVNINQERSRLIPRLANECAEGLAMLGRVMGRVVESGQWLTLVVAVENGANPTEEIARFVKGMQHA